MRKAFLALATLLVLLAPFGEGGRRPLALFLLHTLALGAAACALASPRPLRPAEPAGRRAARLAIAGAGLAVLSASRAAYPYAGLLGVMDVAAAAGLFLAARAWGAGPRDLRRLQTALLAATSMQAVLALARPFTGAAAAGLTFLNPNHLAAWLGIGLLVSVAEAEDRLAGGARPRAALPWVLLAILHLGAAAPLASRGAFLGLATAVVLLAARRARRWDRAARRAAALALLLIAAVGGAALTHRLRAAEDPYRWQRGRIWSASLSLFLEAPVLGAGPGMFPHLAPRHNFPQEDAPFRYERGFRGAHSGWLTLLVENGLPGAACLAAAAILSAAALIRTGAGAAAGPARGGGLLLAALLAHGLVEDLQAAPALVLVPALLAGALLGRSGRRGAAAAPALAALGGPPRLLAAAAAAVLFWAGVAAPWLAHHLAVRARAAGPAGLAAMRLAARLDPLHPGYRHDLAMAELNSGPLDPTRYAGAYLLLEQARRLNPIDPRFPVLMARLEAIAGERLFDDPKAIEHASLLYREAAALAPLDPRPRLELARHLHSRRPEEALAALREALGLEPHYLRARLLETRVLLDLGRRDDARAAWERAEASRARLAAVVPASGYAAELAHDLPEFRERLRADLAPPRRGARQAASR
jgi:O-antigen ligase